MSLIQFNANLVITCILLIRLIFFVYGSTADARDWSARFDTVLYRTFCVRFFTLSKFGVDPIFPAGEIAIL